MDNYDDFKKSLEDLPDMSIRVDRKQLINQLRAMSDNNVEIWICSKNLKFITLKDRYNINKMRTKN